MILESLRAEAELRGQHHLADVLALVQDLVRHTSPDEWGGDRWPRNVGEIGREAW